MKKGKKKKGEKREKWKVKEQIYKRRKRGIKRERKDKKKRNK